MMSFFNLLLIKSYLGFIANFQCLLLAVPNSDEAVYNHDHRKLPLRVNHLEYGLWLLLHPLLKEVCGVLGVSPSQFTPNAITILVGFLVVCHRVNVEHSLCLLGNLVSIKMTRMDTHYYFQYLGGHKVVSNAPDSNRDWEERFVWVMGADPILACPTWLEMKEALKPCILSAEDGQQLEKIRSYAGSREMHNLFDSSSLCVARILVLPPSETEKAQAVLLVVPLNKEPSKDSKGEDSTSAEPIVTNRPQKWLRRSMVPGDLVSLRSITAEITATLGGLGLAVKKEIMERKRKRSAPESSSARVVEITNQQTLSYTKLKSSSSMKPLP